ncbi:MAG TPA: SGNH/GDSL hydrolase family protein [Vicinamibacterales bacterium]
MPNARRTMLALVVSIAGAIGLTHSMLDAQAPGAGYVAVGDSIEFGLGDDVTADGIGYVEPFGAFLSQVLGLPVQLQNFSFPGAETRDIRQQQLPLAVAAVKAHRPVVVSWGGGGNDIGRVLLTPEAAACMHMLSCLGRFNGLWNEAEATIDRTIAALRQAAGPDARILMRTQYNSVAKRGCAPAEAVALGNAVLEGAPGTVLDQGLNDRIRAVAAKYNATVVDLFLPFAFNPNLFVAADCIHPSGAGYHIIETLFEAAYVAG